MLFRSSLGQVKAVSSVAAGQVEDGPRAKPSQRLDEERIRPRRVARPEAVLLVPFLSAIDHDGVPQTANERPQVASKRGERVLFPITGVG